MTHDAMVLHQFVSSHFNEKARWALDWKRLPHTREDYLPGPHAVFIKKLSGQTKTPVLVIGDEVIAGSANLIDALETRCPEARLYPEDPEQRARALAIQRKFDAEVGPATRTAIFTVFIEEPDYLCETFSYSKSRAKQLAYRAALPLVRGQIAVANGVADEDNIRRALEISRDALDFVAKEVGPSGQLVGETFSIADLSCAALLAPLVNPKHPDMARREPVTERMQEFLAQWESHPGAQWVLEQYRRYRPKA